MRTLAAFAALFLVSACQAPPAVTPDNRETNKQVMRDLYAALDAQDFDKIRALCSPDMALQPVGTEESVPLNTVLSDLVPMYYGALEGYHHVIDQLVAEDDWVVARLTFRGTHTGEFQGAQPTGNAFAYGGMHMARVEDGVIQEFWLLEDDLGLMRQLGMELVPAQEG